MYRLRVSRHAKADIKLVSYGDRRPWKDRQKFFDLVNRSLADISAEPMKGKRHVIADMEVFTFHIRRWGRPAYHYFLYRVVGDLVEVGRLLHHAMEPQDGNIPREWPDNAA